MRKVRIFTSLKVLLLSGGVVLSCSGCGQSSNNLDMPSTSLNQESEDSIVDDSLDSYDTGQESLEDHSFDYFSSDLSSIEEFIQQERIEEAKSKIKDVFITGVDFIFYDEPIKGVYFDDLTAEGKEITMNSIDTIGDLGDEFVPNWREGLSEKYQVASEFVSDIYLGVLDKIKNYLGEENYNALGDIKDQVVGDLKDTTDNVKERVKSWYQEFKSSN